MIRKTDDLVDGLRDQFFRELLIYLHDQNEPTVIDRAIQLILVSRHPDRIGDHASNVAENAVNLVQGRTVRHKKEKLKGLPV